MEHTSIPIRVQSRARRDEILCIRGGIVVVRVSAPPLDGRANDAVARVLASRLGVRVAAVRIVRGERARDKVVTIEGLDRAEVERALGF